MPTRDSSNAAAPPAIPQPTNASAISRILMDQTSSGQNRDARLCLRTHDAIAQRETDSGLQAQVMVARTAPAIAAPNRVAGMTATAANNVKTCSCTKKGIWRSKLTAGLPFKSETK